MKTISKIKVVVAALAGAFAWSAEAELQILDQGFTNSVATTLNGVANRYDGHGHVISDDLVLDKTTYLRLKGGTSAAHDTLMVGPTDANAANQHPIITIKNNSGFYCTYRDSSGNPDPDTLAGGIRSYLDTYIGKNGGSGKFVVQSKASKFGGNINGRGLWLEDVFVSANATSEGDYIDILQIDADAQADVDYLVNDNEKPVRIIFNGGLFYDNYNQHSGGVFWPSSGKTIVLEGINGKDIQITKQYYSEAMNNGAGTLRFQGVCNVQLKDGGSNLMSNRLPLRIDANKGPIEWNQTGNLLLDTQAFLCFTGNNGCTPYLPGCGEVRMRSNAIIDLDGTTQRFRTLIAESANAMVTNVSHSTYTSSKLVFGAENTDGIFSAKTYYGVSAEKVGTGTLVVSNVTMDVHNSGKGSFTVKAGTVILVGTNKIGDTDMFESDRFIIEEGATVIREVVIDVASGETTDATAYADGAANKLLRIRKTGAGTLVLSNGESTFSGGLVIDEGTVSVTAAGAQGTGKVTVNSTSTKTCQIEFATMPANKDQQIEYANDIEVTGRSTALSGTGKAFDYSAIVIAQTNQVLKGSITAADDLFIRDDSKCYIGGLGGFNAVKFYMKGDITVAAGHTLYIVSGMQQWYDGKITTTTLQMPAINGYRGDLHLNNSGNQIGTIELENPADNCKTYINATGAAGGAKVVYFSTHPYNQATIRGTFEPLCNTFVQSLEGPAYSRKPAEGKTPAERSGYSLGCNSGYTCTLTITGRDDVDSVTYCGAIGQTSNACTNMTLSVDARPGFTQVFSNVYYSESKELKVKGGTLLLTGACYFPYLQTITVEGTGVLDIGNLTSAAGEEVITQFFPSLKTISIASTAKIKLAEGIELKAAAVMVDGFQLNADTYSTGYSAATLPWIEGAGTIKATTSPTPPVTARDAVWSGGAGADVSTATAANWRDTPPPAFYYLGYRPVFGEGGSEAVFPTGTSLLNGIAFNRAGDFTMRGAEDAKLKLYSGITADNAADADTLYTYDIAAPVESAAASLAFAVPTNRTLRTSGGIAPAEGVAKTDLAKTGLGTLELVDARVAGDLTANTADCGVLKLSGDIGVEGDSGKLIYRNYNYTLVPGSDPKKYYATYCGYLHLDNAIVHKPFNFQSGGSVTCTNGNNSTTWLTCAAGSTNIFKEPVIHAGSSTWLLDSDATIIFEKGYSDPASGGGGFNVGMKTGCRNGTFIFRGPVKMVYTAKGTMGFATASGAKVIFESTGNICTNYYAFAYLNTIFKVDDAFTSTKYFVVDNGGTADTIVDLTTTRQSIPMFWIKSNKGLVKGDYPSEVAITQGLPDESAATTTNFYPIAINGWVKISKSGSGYQKIGSTAAVAYGSYGDLEVSGGTLELMSGTTWLNGTNFIARGDGQLKLTATNKSQIGSQAVFHFADNGTVEIPSGVTVSVAAAFVGETQIGAGTYSAATAEGPMAGRITGEGRLRVRSGMMLILR